MKLTKDEMVERGGCVGFDCSECQFYADEIIKKTPFSFGCYKRNIEKYKQENEMSEKKTMKFWEAMKLHSEGVKVRPINWDSHKYYKELNTLWQQNINSPWELYEEKPVLKVDKLLGKVIIKKDGNIRSQEMIISLYNDTVYTYLRQINIDELNKDYYIQGVDFD